MNPKISRFCYVILFLIQLASESVAEFCNATLPVSCPPYGQCCSMFQFCHHTQETCVSCFPEDLETRESKLQFCRDENFNAATKMLDASCIGACDAMFGRETFLPEEGNDFKVAAKVLGFVCGLLFLIIVSLTYYIWKLKGNGPYCRQAIKSDEENLASNGIAWSSKDPVDIQKAIQIQAVESKEHNSGTVSSSEVHHVSLEDIAESQREKLVPLKTGSAAFGQNEGQEHSTGGTQNEPSYRPSATILGNLPRSAEEGQILNRAIHLTEERHDAPSEHHF